MICSIFWYSLSLFDNASAPTSTNQFEEIQSSLARGIDQTKHKFEDLQITTTILHGTEDQNRSLKEAQALSTYLKGELVILEKCGHMVPVERAEVLAQKLAFQIDCCLD